MTPQTDLLADPYASFTCFAWAAVLLGYVRFRVRRRGRTGDSLAATYVVSFTIPMLAMQIVHHLLIVPQAPLTHYISLALWGRYALLILCAIVFCDHVRTPAQHRRPPIGFRMPA